MDLERRNAVLEEAVGGSHTICFSIKDFTLDTLTEFVKEAKKRSVEIRLFHETSNFHCGVLVEVQRYKDRTKCHAEIE